MCNVSFSKVIKEASSLNQGLGCELRHSKEHFNVRIMAISVGSETGYHSKWRCFNPHFFQTLPQFLLHTTQLHPLDKFLQIRYQKIHVSMRVPVCVNDYLFCLLGLWTTFMTVILWWSEASMEYPPRARGIWGPPPEIFG